MHWNTQNSFITSSFSFPVEVQFSSADGKGRVFASNVSLCCLLLHFHFGYYVSLAGFPDLVVLLPQFLVIHFPLSIFYKWSLLKKEDVVM